VTTGTSTTTVEVAGRRLQVSSLDRVLWPATGTTKAELLQHYLAVAPLLLPHLAGRPLTLHRYPQGVGGPHFFQTRTPPHPPWLRTATLSYPRTGKTFEAPVIDDLAGLVWAVNLTAVELHPFLSRLPDLAGPTALVLDLDPGAPAGLLEACRVALLLRAELHALGLVSWPKTSGGKGLHVYVPVTGATYEQTKSLARRLAGRLAEMHPDLVVERMTKALRAGKVLVDWSQNDAGKSTVAPWSVRGQPVPTVSMPVSWDEVEEAVRLQAVAHLVFDLADVPGPAAHGDAFAPVLAGGQALPP
jgi:bifunctional non-homologous end joining protein LigD